MVSPAAATSQPRSATAKAATLRRPQMLPAAPDTTVPRTIPSSSPAIHQRASSRRNDLRTAVTCTRSVCGPQVCTPCRRVGDHVASTRAMSVPCAPPHVTRRGWSVRAAAIREELDFRVEARNTAAVAAAGTNQQRAVGGSVPVVLPAVHAELCSERVLVIEWLDGVSLREAGQLIDDRGLDQAELTRALLYSMVY